MASSLYHTPVAAVSAGIYSYIRQLNDDDDDDDDERICGSRLNLGLHTFNGSSTIVLPIYLPISVLMNCEVVSSRCM